MAFIGVTNQWILASAKSMQASVRPEKICKCL